MRLKKCGYKLDVSQTSTIQMAAEKLKLFNRHVPFDIDYIRCYKFQSLLKQATFHKRERERERKRERERERERESHENRNEVCLRKGWIIAVVGTMLVRYEVSHYPDRVKSK